MDNNYIQEFEINSLFGYKNVYIRFENSTLIVIGENGFGKTSILNALYFLITQSYSRLLEIKFEFIRIKVKDENFRFDRSLLENYSTYVERSNRGENHSIIDFIRQNIDTKVFQTAIDFINEGKRKDFYNFVNNDTFLKTISGNVLYQELFTWNEQNKAFSNIKNLEQLLQEFNYTVLFFPTYRRVEVDYSRLFPRVDRHRMIRYEEEIQPELLELNIRFGMKDVAKRRDSITDIIRKTSLDGFSKVSGDVIHKLLENNNVANHDLNCTKDELQIILDRTGDRLDKHDKEVILSQFVKRDDTLFKNNFLLFYLQQLLSVYRSQEKYDSAIIKFCDVCNKYLNDKKFVYDASHVTLEIYRIVNSETSISTDNQVELNQLSSGEKQIVSIFSQIYLELDKKYVVLFDEPELSLSIYWQENLLPDIMASGNCPFLMAVTHSPYIFGDKLSKYTVGMREFIK